MKNRVILYFATGSDPDTKKKSSSDYSNPSHASTSDLFKSLAKLICLVKLLIPSCSLSHIINTAAEKGALKLCLAKEKLGYLLTFDKLIDTSPASGLVFRPLTPKLETNLYLIWKRYQTFSPIASKFLAQIKDSFLYG